MTSSKTKDGLEADAKTASPDGFIEAIIILYNEFINRFSRRPTEVALPANAGMMDAVREWLEEHGLRLAKRPTPYQRIQVLAESEHLSTATPEDLETIKETQPVDRTFAPDSDHINSVSYDTDTQILTVEFLKGGTYEYLDVNELMYDAMLALNSEGKSGDFFRQCIRDSHEYVKVEPTPPKKLEAPVVPKLKAPEIVKQKEKMLSNGHAPGDTIDGKDGVYVLVADVDDIASWRTAYDKAVDLFEAKGFDLDLARLSVPPGDATDQLIQELELTENDLLPDSYTMGMLYVGIPSALNDRVSA